MIVNLPNTNLSMRFRISASNTVVSWRLVSSEVSPVRSQLMPFQLPTTRVASAIEWACLRSRFGLRMCTYGQDL